MTLPEFYASVKAFARFHGGSSDEPSDDDFWAWASETGTRPSLQ